MRPTPPQFPELKLPITDYKMQVLRSFLNRFASFISNSLFGNVASDDILTVNFAASNTDTVAIHNLGRLPRGVLVVANDTDGSVIRPVEAKWTRTTVTLRASTAPCIAQVVVL